MFQYIIATIINYDVHDDLDIAEAVEGREDKRL